MRMVNVGKEKDWAVEATVFFLGKELGYVVSPITFGGKCAIMNAYNELFGSKKEADRKFAKTFKPNKKYFAAGYRYKDEKGKEVDKENGVKLAMLAGGQYQDMIDLWMDDDEAGDFTQNDGGYDLKFTRTGKGKQDTEYTVRACKPTPAYKKFAKMEYDPVAMLKEITPSYKETKEMLEKFLNLEPEEDDDDDRKKSSKNKKKRKKDL